MNTEELRKAKRRYWEHRDHAKRRNVPFEISFEDWLKIWLDSGHWLERGPKGNQYCMSRFKDQGSYAVGNVFIQTNAGNISDSHKDIDKAKSRYEKNGQAHKGLKKPKQSEESNKRRSESLKGTIFSEERRVNISKAKMGIPNPFKGIPQPKVQCPHCGKEGGLSGMKRYHFDRCPLNARFQA